MSQERTNFREYIKDVDNFPKNGVRFYDIAPILGNGAIFSELIDEMAEPLRDRVDKVVSFDARGFLFGGAIAAKLEIGHALLRKPGKLSGETYRADYDLEYGSNSLEIQADSVLPGEKIVLVDDIIATGGTALAGFELVNKCGGEVVEFCSVVDLPDLKGSERIAVKYGAVVRSIVSIGEA